jgi:4-hydroxy-2-oxoheptanedioate aldolase
VTAFKDRLAAGDLLHGVLSVIPSPVVAQAVAAAGADFLLIDREHGSIGRESVQAMIAATGGTDCAPLVRVGGIDEAEVKVVLDAGAHGIVYPLVRSAADAERCVSYMRYPPRGTRGWGPFVAHARHGVGLLEHAPGFEERIACGLLIETAEAVEDIDAILDVPGIDFILVAQFDLSTALGVFAQFDAPELVAATERVEQAAKARSIPLGAPLFSAERSAAAVARGHKVLLNGLDVLMLEEQVARFRDWT